MSKFIVLYKKYESIINYFIFGVLSMLVNIASYAFFSYLCHLGYEISTVLSWILAVLFVFVTNKAYVFKTNRNTKSEVIKEIFEFFKYRLLTLGIELVCMWLFIDILGIHDFIAKCVVQVIVVILNYIFSKLFVFKVK